MNETRTRKREHKPVIGKIIAIVILLLIIITIMNPKLLFFLSAEHQSAVERFVRSYITSKNPLSNADDTISGLRLVAVVMVAAVAWGVTQLLKIIGNRITLKNKRAVTMKGLLFNCLNYVIVIYAAMYCLSIMGVNTVAIVASIGVIGLVIGFGAQSLIEDVITGLFIVFEGQFQVGDIVAVDGWRGTVTNVGIRTTQVRDVGGNTRVFNNSDIRSFTNLSNVRSTAIADIAIAYGADLRQAETVVEQCLWALPRIYPDIFKAKPEYLGVESLNDSSVSLRVAASVDEKNIYKARRLLNRELKLALDKGGIEIPFPQVVVHRGPDSE